MGPSWLKDVVFYEVYPQSFYDSNGDGIGDLEGIIRKLEYIRDLGCNAVWLNPIYDSPFKDAGYDVRQGYGKKRGLSPSFLRESFSGLRIDISFI